MLFPNNVEPSESFAAASAGLWKCFTELQDVTLDDIIVPLVVDDSQLSFDWDLFDHQAETDDLVDYMDELEWIRRGC